MLQNWVFLIFPDIYFYGHFQCPKPTISCFHSIVGIEIKRFVHIADLQVNPSSRNLNSKLKSGPNYPVWRYRKSGWFGPNFDFDAWLRPNGVLYNTAIGAIFLILIWASFSVHIVGTYFCSTVLFEVKNLKFLDFRFCGWFGPVVFLKAF